MSKHIVVIVKEPKRRAEGCRDSSGDRRQFRPRKFQFEEPGCFIHSRPAARGKDPACGEAAAWDDLHERFAIKRIEHQEAYGLDGARTDMAEEYFSRRRCAEIGIHQHIAGSHLPWYAGESSWREDECRVSDRDQVNQIAEALNAAHSTPPCRRASQRIKQVPTRLPPALPERASALVRTSRETNPVWTMEPRLAFGVRLARQDANAIVANICAAIRVLRALGPRVASLQAIDKSSIALAVTAAAKPTFRVRLIRLAAALPHAIGIDEARGGQRTLPDA